MTLRVTLPLEEVKVIVCGGLSMEVISATPGFISLAMEGATLAISSGFPDNIWA